MALVSQQMEKIKHKLGIFILNYNGLEWLKKTIVNIINNSPNTDGINPESSKNILIQNSVISVGDDCIAIKSGRNNDGRKRNKPSENIYIRNCIFANGHGGIVIGSELSGGVRNNRICVWLHRYFPLLLVKSP